MSKDEHLQQLIREFKRETGRQQLTSHELAEWAINSNRYEWKPDRTYIVSQCAKDFAHALRNETFIDPQGREVRLNHCVLEVKGQTKFAYWESMKSASPDFIERSFQQQRMAILARCRKLNTAFLSYKENINPNTEMQLVFDFEDDLLEMALANDSA